jgi:ABC-type transport system involved in multi-copper enzyme maturation permease subunit
MFKVFFAEWRKLRRPTLFFGTFLAALFFNGLVTSFAYLMIDSPDGNGDRGRVITREMLALPGGSVHTFASIGGLLGTIVLCVFAAQTAQEYTYGTLRNLLVRQPRRLVLLAGKFAAMKTFALILIVINAAVSIAISLYLSDRAKVATDLWFTSDGWSAIGHTLINVYISTVFFAVIGITLGILLKSPISSISIALVWILILENLIGAVKPSTLKWMPGNQFSIIAQGGSETITYSHALILGTFFVFLALAISSFIFAKRDVAN